MQFVDELWRYYIWRITSRHGVFWVSNVKLCSVELGKVGKIIEWAVIWTWQVVLLYYKLFRKPEEYFETLRFVVSAPPHSSVLRLAVPAIRPSSGTSTIYTLLIPNIFFHTVQFLIFLCYILYCTFAQEGSWTCTFQRTWDRYDCVGLKLTLAGN